MRTIYRYCSSGVTVTHIVYNCLSYKFINFTVCNIVKSYKVPVSVVENRERIRHVKLIESWKIALWWKTVSSVTYYLLQNPIKILTCQLETIVQSFLQLFYPCSSTCIITTLSRCSIIPFLITLIPYMNQRFRNNMSSSWQTVIGYVLVILHCLLFAVTTLRSDQMM